MTRRDGRYVRVPDAVWKKTGVASLHTFSAYLLRNIGESDCQGKIFHTRTWTEQRSLLKANRVVPSTFPTLTLNI